MFIAGGVAIQRRPAKAGGHFYGRWWAVLEIQGQLGDDPEAVRELVCFTAIHWRVARRCGVHPRELTRSHLARLMAEDAARFEDRCAAEGLPVAPRAQIDEAAARASRFFAACIENGAPPSEP